MVRIEDRELYLLHSQLRGFQRLVESTEGCIEVMLARCQRPYVAWSTGKDSTAMLHLVRQQLPDIPVVYFDAECAFPESEALLDAMEEGGLHLIRYPVEAFLETLIRAGIDNPAIDAETLRTTTHEPIARLVSEYGFDGCFVGTRAEEAYGRKMLYRHRGDIFWSKKYGYWQCIPMARWKFRDIWAYLVSRDVPYNALYDEMSMMPEEDRRMSYWAGETKKTWGRWVWLQMLHPELFAQFAERIPDVRRYV